ncbi:hypothetical protein T484DRAFT_1758378, partial [Baffinella frigidus]
MKSVIPEDDKVRSMIAQLAELPRASDANSAMLVFNTLNEEVGFVDNYMTSVPLDAKTDTTMREKLVKFSSILAKEHTDDTIEITKNDRVKLKGIRTLLGKDMGERLDRVVSERSKTMGQLCIYFEKSPSDFFSGLQNGLRDDISKDHIRVTYQVQWEALEQKLDYAKDHKDDLEGLAFGPNYKAGVRQSQKKIEHGLFEYLVVGMLSKSLLQNVPAEPMGLGGKLAGFFGLDRAGSSAPASPSSSPADPSDTGPGPASSAPASPSSSPAASPPTHTATTTEGHGTTGYTLDWNSKDEVAIEEIFEHFRNDYTEWMSTLQHNMTPIMNAQESTHIRENIHAIQSTHIFHPDTSHEDIEEYWTYSQNVLKEKQWTKWCETEEELDAKNQDEYDTKFSN